MSASLDALKAQRDQLQGIIAGGDENDAAVNAEVAALRTQLEEEQALGADALSRVALLNQQLRAPAPADRRAGGGARGVRACRARRARRSSPISAAASTWRSPSGCRSSTASGPTSSAACATSWRSAPASRSSATASCSSPRCCFRPAPTRSTRPASEELATLARELIDLNAEIPDDIDWVSAGGRAHGCAAHLRRALLVQLGAVGGARHLGGAVPHRAGGAAAAAWSRPASASSTRWSTRRRPRPTSATAASN